MQFTVRFRCGGTGDTARLGEGAGEVVVGG
jgi:hypothetical protein